MYDDAIGAGGDGLMRHIEKKRVFEDAREGGDPVVEDAGFGEGVEPVIDEKISTFRDDGTVLFVAEAELGSFWIKETFEAVRHRSEGLWDDLCGEGEGVGETIQLFSF